MVSLAQPIPSFKYLPSNHLNGVLPPSSSPAEGGECAAFQWVRVYMPVSMTFLQNSVHCHLLSPRRLFRYLPKQDKGQKTEAFLWLLPPAPRFPLWWSFPAPQPQPCPCPPTPQPLNLSCLSCSQNFPLPLSSHLGK